MKLKIAVIPGDGVGPEIMAEAIKVLNVVGEKFDHEFSYRTLLAGGVAIDVFGVPMGDRICEALKA